MSNGHHRKRSPVHIAVLMALCAGIFLLWAVVAWELGADLAGWAAFVCAVSYAAVSVIYLVLVARSVVRRGSGNEG